MLEGTLTPHQERLATRRAAYAANPQPHRDRMNTYRAMNRERYRRIAREFRWRREGLCNPDGSVFTQDDYDRLFDAQGGLCALCDNPEKITPRTPTGALAADHDHASGRVRGLLCRRCNQHRVGRAEAAVSDVRVLAYLGLEVHRAVR